MQSTNGIVLAFAAVALILQPANAEVITFEFSGILTIVNESSTETPLDGSISVGTPYAGFFTFDTDAIDFESRSTRGGYEGPEFLIEINIGNYVLTADHFIDITNNEPGFGRDHYGVADNFLGPVPRIFSNGVDTYDVSWGIVLSDLTGTAFPSASGDALPIVPPNLTDFGDTNRLQFGIRDDINDQSSSHVFEGALTSLSLLSANEPPATLNIFKITDAAAAVPGIEFTLTNPDGFIEACTTDVAGQCTFVDLLPGTYTLTEPSPPPGTRLAECLDITADPGVPADEDPMLPGIQIVLGVAENAFIRCINERLGTVNVSKVLDNGAVMPNVGFVLTGPDGFNESCTTNENGQCLFVDLLPGSYSLSEPNPPSGTRFAGCIPDVDENPDAPGVQFTLGVGENFGPRCINERLGTVNLFKVLDNGAGMPNVDFVLTGPDGFNESCTTNENGQCLFVDLLPGSYSLSEPNPPSETRFAGCIPDVDENPDAPGVQFTLGVGENFGPPMHQRAAARRAMCGRVGNRRRCMSSQR